MTDLRVGLVGAGWIGSTHVGTLAELPGARLVAVADPVAEWAEHRDAESMLAGERLDAVLVCTPPDAHRAAAVAAAERGVAVYLEKPVAHSVEDAYAIAAAIGRAGVICSVGYQYRALDFLDALGGDVALMAGTGVGRAFHREWLGMPERGGSIVFERASHLIDLQRALAREVETVAGAESPGTLALLLRFARGALGTITVCDAGEPGWRLDITRPDGESVAAELGPRYRLHARGSERPHAGRRPLEASLAGFLDAVRAGDPTRVPCPLTEGVATLEVALAAQRALHDGEVVAVRSPQGSGSASPPGLAGSAGVTPGSAGAPDDPSRRTPTTSE
jgi:predicted dehydrogenase